MAKEEKEVNVTILSVSEITVYPKINQPKKMKLVTYVGGGLPPATIQIPVEEYNEETLKRKIREDLEKRLKSKPYTIRV